MKKKLKTQLENPQLIRDVLREVDISFTVQGQPVETLLVYLPCKNGACDYSDLFRIIRLSLLTNFVLRFTEIEEKLSIDSGDAPELLFKKAARKISKQTAKGELGELILFTLLEVYFDAPKILSKITDKSSKKMPVFGADAVHAQYVDGAIRLYLGESKLHKSFSSASSKAAKSISSALEKYREEFDLIESNIDFPEMNTEVRNELLALLNPYSKNNKFNSEILHSPCFIGFVDPSIFSDDASTYMDQYVEVAKKHIGNFYSKMKTEGNDINRTALMLLPFSCIDNLVDEFTSYIGVE
jgi:hypothetical protein